MNKRFNLRIYQVAAIIIVTGLLGYIIGSHKVSLAWQGFTPLQFNREAPPSTQNLDMSLFYDVLDKVNQDYYDSEKIDSQEIVNGAVSGMLQSLEDPYTSFFPAKENQAFKEQLAGEFQGIGAELSLNDDSQIAVVAPLDGSPAKAAGIRSGDIIAAVDGEETRGWTVANAVEKIRGEKGTPVILTVLHDGERQLQDIKIVRDVINIKSVTGWVKTMDCRGTTCKEVTKAACPTCSQVAYIRLSQFGDKTNNEWVEHINTIYPQMESGNTAGVILDLRNNPGGYLQDAVFISSEFVDEGVIVIQDNGKGNTTEMPVSRRGLMTDKTKFPMYVLINKGSASASEIVAGALRDYNRAILIGENSFGKGTIQQAIEVGNGASVHLSVAKWLTPKKTWVHKTGLKPDMEVKFDATKSAALAPQELDNQLEQTIREIVN